MTSVSFWARVAQSPRVVVDFATGQFFNQLPWALAAMAISSAGIVVAFIFIKIAECLTKARSNERWIYHQSKKKFDKQYTHSTQSMIRLIFIILALMSVILGFWIGANTAGFNFWTLILGYGIVSIVITYSFGTVLKSAGAFLAIALTDKLEEDWVVSLSNNVRGRVKGIYILWVELEDVTDLENGTYKDTGIPPAEIQVPTWQFLDLIVRRDMKTQVKIEKMMMKQRKQQVAEIQRPFTLKI